MENNQTRDKMKSINILAEEFVVKTMKGINSLSKTKKDEVCFYIKSMREIALGKYPKQISIEKYNNIMNLISRLD